MVVLELDHRREGAPHLAAKALQRAYLAVLQQFVDFFGFPLPAGHHFPQLVVALFAGEVLVAFVNLGAAARTGGVQRAEVGVGKFAGLDALDHLARLVHDMVHELVATKPAMFHFPEFVFPFAGEFGRADFVYLELFQREQEREGLGRRLQFAAVAMQVFLGQEALDGGRARRRRAEAALGHGFAQFLVLDQLAGAFHGGEQRGFRETRRRLRGLGLDLDVLGPDALALFQRRQVEVFAGLLAGFLRFLAIHRQPARRHQYLAFGLERFFLDARDACGDVEFGGRIEDGEKAFGDQVVDLLFGLGKALRRCSGGDDGEVVRDLGIVENALVRMHPSVLHDRAGECRVGRAGHRGESFLDRADVVLGQVAGVGSRIGQRLVLFVQCLGQPQRVLGGKAEAAVGLALQAGEVVEHRTGFGLGPAFVFRRAMLAEAFLAQGIGFRLVPQALGAGMFIVSFFELFIEPAAAVSAGDALEFAFDFPVVARDEGADAAFAFDHDRQCRRLHAAHRRLVEAAFLRIEGGHGARAVDADQPVGFRAAARGVGQRQHFMVGAQMGEAVADCGAGHRLQPEAADGFLLGAQGVLRDVTENQLALAPRVAGIDQTGDILALDQAGQQAQALRRPFDWIQGEVRRNHRQMGETPLAALDVEFFRHREFQQVADGRGQHVVVAFEVVAGAGKTAQRFRNVLGDGRFLGDDKLL